MPKENNIMKNYEDKYINNLLYHLDNNIKIVGGTGLFDKEGFIKQDYRNMDIEELARHLFLNGVEFKIHNRRITKDPLRLIAEIEESKGE